MDNLKQQSRVENSRNSSKRHLKLLMSTCMVLGVVI